LKQGTYTGLVDLTVTDRDGNIVEKKTVSPKTYWKKYTIEAEYKEPFVNDYTVTVSTTAVPGSGETFEVSSPVFYKNNYIVIRGYKKVVEDDCDILWNSSWLKSYATALVKKQWAQNLKKFEGVSMPGGVTLNGQQIYDDAEAELEKLGEDLELKYSFPPKMIIG
jgi:hypothetical protein